MKNCKHCTKQRECNDKGLYWQCDGEYKTITVLDNIKKVVDKIIRLFDIKQRGKYE
jgi:hypothetical protein